MSVTVSEITLQLLWDISPIRDIVVNQSEVALPEIARHLRRNQSFRFCICHHDGLANLSAGEAPNGDNHLDGPFVENTEG